MKKLLQILNGVAFISVVIVNYLSNTGMLNNTTIGKISRGLNSLFTPAGYAFSIWGFIYFLLLGFVIYQGKSLFVAVKNDEFINNIGVWFLVSCIANSAWVFAWIYEYTGLSCLFIFGLLFSLLKIVMNTKMQLKSVSKSMQFFVWLPFAVYSGWVSVASVANVSSYLVKIGWNGFGISNEVWTIVMIIIATAINIIVLWTRDIKAFVLVGAWALVAIGIANETRVNTIHFSAYVAAFILVLNATLHFFKNRNINIK